MKKIALMAACIILFIAAQAQNTTPCGFQYGRTEQDSIKCLEKITTYRMSITDPNKYEDAYTAWRYIVNECPCSYNGAYNSAHKMLNAMIKAEKDSMRRERLIDTLLWMYSAYAQNLPNKCSEGYAIGQIGYYQMQYRSKTHLEEAFQNLITCVETEQKNTDPSIWNLYFTTATRLVQAGMKDTTVVVEAYERANEYIDDGIVAAYEKYEADTAEMTQLETRFQNNEIDKIKYDKRMNFLTQDTAYQIKQVGKYRSVMAKIENGFVPYASCDILEGMYSAKIDANRENIVALKKMLLTLNKFEECRKSTVYKDILEIVHSKEPNAQTAHMMGNFYMMENDLERAAEYYNEAIRTYTTNNQKAQPYYFLAYIEYKKHSFSSARSYCYKALQCDPSYGNAYLLIGDMYAASVGQFNGEQEGVIPGAVYWAAADKYAKAVAVDPSLAGEANKRRARLGGVSGEYIFKKGYSKGQTYHIGGWIQENTTVR